MNPLEFLPAVSAIPQGIVAIFQLLPIGKGARRPATGWRVFFAATLVVGAVLTVWIGERMWNHPPADKIVYKTVQVTQPCPPEKTGTATTKGNQSPASTGNNNSVTYGTPA